MTNIDQFQDKVIHFQVINGNTGLYISRFSENVTDSMKIEIGNVVDCINSDKFLENQKFDIIYMHIQFPDHHNDDEGYIKEVAYKFKKKYSIKGKTCTINSWYRDF